MYIRQAGLALASALLIGGVAAEAQKPVISKLNDRTRSGSIEKLSDNGEWGVGYGKSPLSELGYSYPRLFNVQTKEMKWLYKSGEEQTVAEMAAYDVTDDGKIVAGQYKSKPAIWNADTEEWILLPYSVSASYPTGSVTSITPDGKYAIGTVVDANWNESMVVWQLNGTTATDITPDNLPQPVSLEGRLQDYKQVRAMDLAPDGSKFIGMVAYSYAGETWSFVYDMNAKKWSAIGYLVSETGNTGSQDKIYNFTQLYQGFATIEGGSFRHGTNEIVGYAYCSDDQEGIYVYDIETGDVSIIESSKGMLYGGVDNNGVIYASAPSSNPLRDWYAMVGKYWYDFKVLAKQVWNLDWQAEGSQDDYGYTGTFASVSNDGLTLVANDYTNTPYDSFVIVLPQSLYEVAPSVNLLSNYAVAPVNNSSFATLSEVKVTFDREIDVTGAYNAVTLVDEAGTTVATSISLARDVADSRTATATFRNRRLEVGKTYTVTFPAGICNVAGDTDKKNPEVSVTYNGRPDAPVAPVSVVPASNTTISRINSTSNPVVVTFDSEIAPVEKDAGKMYLYRLNDEGDRERIAQLSGSTSGNQLSIFPVMEQRLAKGSSYEVVIEANTVADISGADPNEEYVIAYEGSYVPDPGIGSTIFSDDFNTGIDTNKWMLYDGDDLEPGSEPQGWGFSQGLAWWLARDTESSTEMAAVSHSMYTTPGKSNDWLVTQQLYIPDDSAVLTFKSQGYRRSATDRLKVYVYATDDVITALTESITGYIKDYGDLVFDEVQDPGTNEDTLEGDWTENLVELGKYAGKNIYVAFLNDNRNQSAVFVDDVAINRDVKYTLTNLTSESVLRKDDIEVKGILSITSETDSYKGYSLSLLDSEGKEISKIADAGEELKKGWELEFTFPEALPLTIGRNNAYTIAVNVGDLSDKLEASVQDLALETTKRVVIEKYTGQGCQNCPLGILAHDYIHQDFGNNVLMLAYHCYTGDNFNTPQANNMNTFLGMNAAPSARINRADISMPFYHNGSEYLYKNNGLWYDYVAEELNTLAPADITVLRNEFVNDQFEVQVAVQYALDMENVQANLLVVITEDNLVGSQSNNLYNIEDPVLGEWGKGGKYGNANNTYTYDDVVRTWAGTTGNGTGGYIPSSVKGGETYNATIKVPTISRILDPSYTKATVLLVDAETGRVLNAAQAKEGFKMDGVSNVSADRSGAEVKVIGNDVIVSSNEHAQVTVVGLDGSILARGEGEGIFSVSAGSYRGVAVVMVQTAQGVSTFKVMMR